jgi:hypothetical protein
MAGKRRQPEERQALAQAVIDGMTVRGISCFKACEAAGVPMTSFMRWVDEDAALAERYAGAREAVIERMADDIMTIADKAADDAVAVQKQRLQVDTRKWLLSKLAPKKYGDSITHKGDENAPLRSLVQITPVDAKL